jgi:hypothetical protein
MSHTAQAVTAAVVALAVAHLVLRTIGDVLITRRALKGTRPGTRIRADILDALHRRHLVSGWTTRLIVRRDKRRTARRTR